MPQSSLLLPLETLMLQSVLKKFRSHPVVPDKPPSKLQDWAWTPDQAVLEQYAHQLVFIPDELMVGDTHPADLEEDHPLHGITCRVVNPSCYTHSKFLAYGRDLGKDSEGNPLIHPVIMPGDYQPSSFLRDPPEPAKVRGELHSCYANRIYLLDKYKQNGVRRYSRHRVKITYPFRNVRYDRMNPLPDITHHGFTTIVAWMYVGIPSYWDAYIGGVMAQPMPLYTHEGKPRPWIGEFFDFKQDC